MSVKAQLKNNKTKIIIIGAGVAGLSAAHYLKNNGYEPLVLEAQDKIGGRLQTDRSLGMPFDKGASWIHGPIKNPITDLAKKSGITTFLTSDSSHIVYDTDGSVYSSQELEREENKYELILDELKGKKSKSFADIFYSQYPECNGQRLWTYMLSAYLEFDTGGDINELSSKYFYDDEEFKGEDVIVTNGYDRIARYLAQDIDIRLNTKVTKIDYSHDQTLIWANSEKYTADAVIVAVPLGVLKKNVIEFLPTLPTKTQKVINSLEMGSVNKFLLVWDTAFWDEDIQYIGYTPEEKGKFNYFLNIKKFADANALMTFTYGEYSKEVEKMPDAQVVEEIMAHLQNMYGADIPKPIQFLRTKWGNNEYTYGAYSFVPYGVKSKAYKAFEKNVNNKLFFAGEHTIHAFRATVHGAFLSGIREAKKVVK